MIAIVRCCIHISIDTSCKYILSISSLCPSECDGYQCSGGQSFQMCANPCGTCRDQQLDASYCDSDECVSGCSCPDGQLLDDYGQCVNKEQCSCYDLYDPQNPLKGPGDISKRGCANWYVPGIIKRKVLLVCNTYEYIYVFLWCNCFHHPIYYCKVVLNCSLCSQRMHEWKVGLWRCGLHNDCELPQQPGVHHQHARVWTHVRQLR
jgi:hypothetical protein